MFSKLGCIGIFLFLAVSAFAQDDEKDVSKLKGNDRWLNRLLYSNEQRCLKEEIPVLATRHGFDAWLKGSNPQPNLQEAITKLREKDREQIRVTELVFDESFLSLAATMALKNVDIPKNIKLSIATLNCHPPKFKLGTQEDQKIHLSFNCDTSYTVPWKSSCVVSDTNPCTSIEVSLKPYYKPIDLTSTRLGAEIMLEKMYFSFPSLEQYLSVQTTDMAQKLESYTQELKSSLEQASNINTATADALSKIKDKYGPAHDLVIQIEESAKRISEYFSILMGLGKDQAEFSQLSQLLVGVASQNAGDFEAGFSVVAPAIQAVLRGIGSLEDQMVEAYEQLGQILKDVDSSVGNVETSLKDLNNKLITLKETADRLDQSVKELKAAFKKIDDLGAKQDESVKVLWQTLVTNLKYEFHKLPRSFPLFTVKPMTKNLGNIPALGGEVRVSAHIGIPRIETTTAFGGRKVLVFPIKTDPLRVSQAKNGSLK